MLPGMALPQTIQIYLPQGDPTGIRMAEFTTRTVRVFEVPRPLLSEFRKMQEASQGGVYYLLGTSDAGRPLAYIGQTGAVGDRLQGHDGTKPFWDRALVAVSLTNSWTNTHTWFMEWQSIRVAKASGRYALENGNDASNPHTPAPLEADCREYLSTISMLLATLGHPLMEPLVPESKGQAERPAEELFLTGRQSDARAVATSEGLVVLAGSSGLADLTTSCSESTGAYRERLIAQGAAEAREGRFVMLEDHLFRSPTTAAAVLMGRNVNGRLAWRDASGASFQEIEERKLISPN